MKNFDERFEEWYARLSHDDSGPEAIGPKALARLAFAAGFVDAEAVVQPYLSWLIVMDRQFNVSVTNDGLFYTVRVGNVVGEGCGLADTIGGVAIKLAEQLNINFEEFTDDPSYITGDVDV